jgi:hypothetical protein
MPEKKDSWDIDNKEEVIPNRQGLHHGYQIFKIKK